MVGRALLFVVLILLVINVVPRDADAVTVPLGSPASFVFGDADCSGAVDPLDAVEVLYDAAGLADGACSAITDVQCDADRDAGDAVEVLRQHAAFGPGTPGCPPIGTSLAAAEPDPTPVSPVLDDDLKITSALGPEGGEVTATGEDGTVFTLSIPEGALVVDEDVTLTPISSIGGLPLSGGLVGGVMVGPEDLVFVKPVVLTITPAQAPAGPEIVGFGFTGDEFFLYPLLDATDPSGITAQGELIRLPGIGPGGYGAGSGTQADIDAQQGHPPTSPEDQFAQALDEIFREHDHSSPEFDAALEAALRQYYLNGLLIALQYAPDDCDVTRGLLVPYLKWLGIIQGFLGGNTLSAEIGIMQNGLALGVANCFEESYRRCVDTEDVGELFFMMKYLGVLQSGIVGNPDLDELIGDYLAKIDECTPDPCTGTVCRWVGSAHAEVYFTASTQDRTYSITVENIVFELDEDQDPNSPIQGYRLVSAGPITWEASGTSGQCVVSGTMTLDPPGIDGDYTHTTGAEARGGLTENHASNTYSVVFNGGDPDARLQITCEGGNSEQQWPGVPVINSGIPFPTFNDPGTNTIADGEYYDPSESYGGRWTWDLRKVE